MQKWFAVNTIAGTIAIHSDIGSGGLKAGDFQKQLEKVRGSALHISINSNGGDVTDGFAIYNMLARHSSRKVVTIEGIAASMASVIAMVGDTIIMPQNALMMIHNPWGSIAGGADQIESFGGALKRMQANIVSAYTKRTKQPADKIQAMMDRETWLTAAEAVELGFADKIEGGLDMAASLRDMDLRAFKRVPNIGAPQTLDDIQEAAWRNWNKTKCDNASVPREAGHE